MAKDERTGPSTDRRGFLKFSGLGAVAAGAVAVGSTTTEAAAAPAAEPTGSGYRETAHVKTVYSLARF